MLSQHGGRFIWIHHHECGFDWKLIDKLRPDEVWWAPTERFLICDPGVVPIGFKPEGPIERRAPRPRQAVARACFCAGAAISPFRPSCFSPLRSRSEFSGPTVRRRSSRKGASSRPRRRCRRSAAGWLALPKEVDAYLRDHFGLRQALIRAHKELTKPMLGFGNDFVLVGRKGRIFYLGEDTVRQSAGLILRDERVSQTSALLARINAALAARGIKFLVAIPPNASTIYQDDLPAGPRSAGAGPNTICFWSSSGPRASARSTCGR